MIPINIQTILNTFLGTYTILRNVDGSVVCGFAGVDWSYIFSFVLLLVGFVYTLKLLFELIKMLYGGVHR